MVSSGAPSPALRAFVHFTVRYGRLIWLVALALAVPATWRTVDLYLHLRSEVEQLLPRDAPSVRALDEMRGRSPGLEFLGVVAEVRDAAELRGAERFLDDLGDRIRAYPPEMVREVRSNNKAEKAFVEKHAPLYADVADLEEILHRIQVRRDYEVSKESGSLLDEDEPPPPVDVTDIENKYDQKISADSSDYMASAQLKAAMLTVESGGFTTGAEKDRALLERVKADVAALDPARYAAGMRVGYASDVAINVEELDALQADLSVSSALVVVAVMAAIVLYYRWWKSIPVLIPPLLLATVYAFALASLPPLRITELNSNTAFLGSIIVGNGINVGLILLARYREERLRGATVDEALVVGVWGARVGTLAAAAAAGVSYASLVVTEFRGFRQFGCIGGIGMLASWATAFVLVPPLLKWLDRGPPVATSGRASRRATWLPARGSIMGGLVWAVQRTAPVLVAVSAALAVAAAAKASTFDSSYLEHNFNKLRRADTWKNGEGYWGRKMDAILGHYLTPTVVLCGTREQARSVEALVRQSVDAGALRPFVARVVGVDDVLPTQQQAKIDVTERIREALTPKIRSLVPHDKLEKIDRMLGAKGLTPIRAADLPPALTTGLRERDGTIGRAILVYPRPSDALWKADSMRLFVKALRDLAADGSGRGAPAFVAGSIPLSSDILASIGRDAPIASSVSLAGVVAVVFVVLRARRASFYVIGSLLLGVLWLAGETMALGIKINFSNFIAFPITFGIGVDYAVNVMTRYVQDGEDDVGGAVRSTGGAVALCSLTTIIGYSSLLLAKNRALFLFGLLAVMGEVACLTAAVVALPAWLVFARRFRRTSSRHETHPAAHA
ncbi:MAG TPA: MMPL family transporter [Polyangiaceae bacterium]|nr:MMPL family transporter [Polyangiaceae bacterium]